MDEAGYFGLSLLGAICHPSSKIMGVKPYGTALLEDDLPTRAVKPYGTAILEDGLPSGTVIPREMLSPRDYGRLWHSNPRGLSSLAVRLPCLEDCDSLRAVTP